MNLILASGSPRRAQLLRAAGYAFETLSTGADERIPPQPPQAFTVALALRKARAAAQKAGRGCVVVGADTVVFDAGEILGKPRGEQDARRMLRRLSGRTHEVFTGVAAVSDGREETFCERTAVRFFPLSDALVERYVRTGEPLDKAGGYGIQGAGSLLVAGIDGDYYNVMGLPVGRLARLLWTAFGIAPLSRSGEKPAPTAPSKAG